VDRSFWSFFKGSILFPHLLSEVFTDNSRRKEMRFFEIVLNAFGAIALWAGRMVLGLLEACFHGIGAGLSHLLARTMPLIVGGGVILLFPQVLGPLMGVGILLFALWIMVGGRRKK